MSVEAPVVAALREISAKLQGSTQFLPSTFEERGMAVPFTTPLLAHARARKNYRDQLELCVPQFASAEGHYVIPWSAACELTQPTLHDRLLYDYVVEHDVKTPHTMRLASLAVAKDGIAGPEVAAAASRALAKDEEQKAVSHVVLILRVLSETGKAAAVNLREISSKDRQEHVRHALFSVASSLGVAAEILDERLSQLAIMTYTVGVAWNPVEGRLRALVRSLAEFRDAARRWGADQLHESGEKAVFCSEVADLTVLSGDDLVKRFDALLKSPFKLVVAWDKAKGEPERLADRLSWLLDGWEMIIEWWQSCENDSERIAAAEQIIPVLPLIPRNELGGSQREEVNGLIEKGRRWVRLNQNWATGELDYDMIHRIEAVKARTK